LFNFDFIGAELLKVQIRKNWFARWMTDGDLEKDYYVLKKKYDEGLGLLKNEDDSRIIGNDIFGE